MRGPVNEAAVVYAVDAAGRIKIGTTTRLDDRLRAIGAVCPVPLFLLGTRPGDYRLEAALHREFKPWRIHGEWFVLPMAQREILRERLEGVPRLIELPKANRKAMMRTKPKRRYRGHR